jgi:hypothetical protein
MGMDVENLLTRASDHLSVRRAFGAAYEKDGMLINPGRDRGRRRRGLRRTGPALRRLCRERRPRPLGTRTGHDHPRPGLSEPRADAGPHTHPCAAAPRPVMKTGQARLNGPAAPACPAGQAALTGGRLGRIQGAGAVAGLSGERRPGPRLVEGHGGEGTAWTSSLRVRRTASPSGVLS